MDSDGHSLYKWQYFAITQQFLFKPYDDKRISVGDRMYVDRLISPLICPITELEMSGRFKIVFPCSSCRGVALTTNLGVGKLLREVIASMAGQSRQRQFIDYQAGYGEAVDGGYSQLGWA